MKKFINKIVASLLCTVTLFTMSAAAYAATPTTATNDYQRVVDNLNAEYNTNVQLPNTNLRSDSGSYRNVPLSEFEISIRNDIEANLKAQAEADAMIEARRNDKVIASGSGVCGEPNISARASYNVTQGKDVAGATALLDAMVNYNGAYWTYLSIYSVRTTYNPGVNSSPAFGASTYSYNLIDAYRTCATTLYGYTMGDWGVIIDNNAYRYVEFWAGNGM